MNDSPIVTARRKPGRSLAQDLMDTLAEQIRNGGYEPGQRLPTEPEVMAQHGVSRTVVREAISRLQAAGLVETRHGIGSFVLAPVPSAGELLAVVTLRDVLDMLELRISLETEAAGLAALRRKDEHLVQMRNAVNEFEQELMQGGKSVEADFQFHLQIALATHNKYFEDFYRHLGTTTIPRTRLDTSQLSEEPSSDYLTRTNREHADILDAIARREPEAARAAMRMHLTNSRERLRRVYERNQNAAPATANS
ncbi:FadR/GntR family transcriptional regulator [Uliginosibacterium gangwonense]|uniref:FadR/GntR family transcriptional regulator n=1 Tax=Uliginosibacterium gangwonense TaxID=392736 RepID=UPI00035D50AC|nr:FadR/GntR family transcriptional regulator [Uliginosibacterium gangwonense]